jgi:V/A-type H+/Na+-transporting ATPase subunit A
LLEIVQLVGPDALAESERTLLTIARMLREDFLQQSAYHDIDRYCPVKRSYLMLSAIMDFYHRTQAALEAGVTLEQIATLSVVAEIARLKERSADEVEEFIKGLMNRIRLSFAELGVDENA